MVATLYTFARIAKLLHKRNRTLTVLNHFSNYVLYEFCYGRIEDVILACTVVSVTIYLFAMSLAGPCIDLADDTVDGALCNPQGKGFPLVQYTVLFLSPIITVTVFRGVSFHFTVLVWMICMGFILYLFISQNNRQFWALIGLIIVPVIALYDIEKNRLIEYFRLKQAYVDKISEEEVLKSKIEGKSIMIRYLSHEIRSPLNVAKSIFNLMNIKKDSVIDTSECLEDIQSSVDAAIEILDQLLHIEKLESGKFVLEKSWTSITDHLPDFLKRFSTYFQEKGIKYTLEMSSLDMYDFPILGNIDKLKIDQICRNLLVNAAKFSPLNNGVVTVRASLQEIWGATIEEISDILDIIVVKEDLKFMNHAKLKIDITDNGVGIDPKYQDKLFQEFSQIQANTLQGGGGSGLGLWISKELAKLHGGDMSFFSEGVSLGSTFSLSFPVVLIQKGISEGLSKLLASKHIKSQLTSNTISLISKEESVSILSIPSIVSPSVLRILIADDCLLNRKVLNRIIHTEVDCEVVEVGDGLKAVEVMRESMISGMTFDIVFMDYIMPNLNGPNAVKQIRSLGFESMIIGATGNALTEDINSFLSMGATQVLVKPFDISSITNILEQFKPFNNV
jgi:signal transduction histidine kinase/ActR/RegA family two-component response regulator